MRKAIKQQEEKNAESSAPSEPTSQPLPQYLLDREKGTNAKALSSAIKNKRSEKAAKFSVPLPKVRGISEEEMFKVVKTGKKTAKKGWKRMITKPTFGASLPLSFLLHFALLLLVRTRSCSVHRPRVHAHVEQQLTSDEHKQSGQTSPAAPSNTNASSGPWACATKRLTSRTPSSA